MPDTSQSTQHGFLRQFRGLLRSAEGCSDLDLRGSLRLGKATLRLPPPTVPLQLLLGGEEGYRLHLYPELALDPSGHLIHQGSYLLVDPLTYFSDISGFVRLCEGDSLMLGREDPLQRRLLRYPRTIATRHLRLKLSAAGLALKRQTGRAGACVAPLLDTDLTERMARWRMRQIEHLARVLGGPIEPLPRTAALEQIERIIALMEQEPYRALNHGGRPGGLLVLPDRASPIFVGDLRGRVDNLLVILTQNSVLQALEEGSATLIILGNAVHPAQPEQAAEMGSSMLMMDLIFRLKLRFPERVFYLRGYHDSFSADISHAGLPQGSLWEDAVHQARGPRYRDAMRRFYTQLPLVAVTTGYLAAAGDPPIGAHGWQSLVDIDRQPALADRIVRSDRSSDGTGREIRRRDLIRLFQQLGLSDRATCVLGTAPKAARMAGDAPRQGALPQQRVFSADSDWVDALPRAHRRLLPLSYPTEPLLDAYNRFARTGRLEDRT
jgi:hypothetical protein